MNLRIDPHWYDTQASCDEAKRAGLRVLTIGVVSFSLTFTAALLMNGFFRYLEGALCAYNISILVCSWTNMIELWRIEADIKRVIGQSQSDLFRGGRH